MTGDDRQHEIDRLIDGAIDAGVEPAAPDDESVGAELALQRRIDGSLRGLFDPGDAAGELALGRRIDESLRRQFEPEAVGGARAIPIRRRRWVLGVGVAAAVLLAGAAAVIVAGASAPAEGPAAVYAAHTSSGVVTMSCETPDQFEAWVSDHFGVSIRPEAGEGLTFVGWNYEDTISPSTGVMLGKARGEDVIVIVDRAERDPGLRVAPGSGLNLFRRELGGLVFYEVTPLTTPVFLETLRVSG